MEKKKKNEVEDKMSDLPDSLLHHIFSFLKIQEAVRSSVLSKRWRYLWTSLPTLNFEYGEEDILDDEVERCKRFVDKVLILRDGSNIHKFSFLFPSHSSLYVNNDWIISALRRNVEELVIEICFEDHFRLPNCLFNSKSLTILKLVSWGDFLRLNNIPDSMCLPNLKTMFLDTTMFGGEDDDDQTNRFFSSCPVLESLTISNSMFHQTNLKISSLSLKHLTIERSVNGDDIVTVDGSVNLCTPNLILFHCTDYMEKNYALENNLSSLFKASINLTYYDDELLFSHSLQVKKNMYGQRMLKFLGALHNVTELTLSAAILETFRRLALDRLAWNIYVDKIKCTPFLFEVLISVVLCHFICLWVKSSMKVVYQYSNPCSVPALALLESNPIYRNLISLKMHALLSGDCIHTIICLLQMSPAIETLYINFFSPMIEENWEVELPSECLLNHLKRVEIRRSDGSVNELKFLETLLKNAVVLETLMIVFASTEVLTDRETQFVKFGEKLRAFPKASSSITIMLI